MSPRPVRVLVHGASGRMGRALLRLAASDPRFVLVAAVSRGTATIVEAGAVPVSSLASREAVPAFDVAIDFSLAPGFDPILALCVERGAALVSGTTGLAAPQFVALDAAALRIPVLWAANFSLGVAVLAELVTRAAAMLPGWDTDIVEMHHVHKRDAPSGTALALGRALEAGGAREPHYASLRAGDIVGEHTVQFTAAGERIELVHRATERDVFARGALECAARLVDAGAGRHAIADLLLAGPRGA
jgi:4-hydroxy-tetrahydrodipicolinate reductase